MVINLFLLVFILKLFPNKVTISNYIKLLVELNRELKKDNLILSVTVSGREGYIRSNYDVVQISK